MSCKWTRYPEEENTWKLAEHLQSAEEILKASQASVAGLELEVELQDESVRQTQRMRMLWMSRSFRLCLTLVHRLYRQLSQLSIAHLCFVRGVTMPVEV